MNDSRRILKLSRPRKEVDAGSTASLQLSDSPDVKQDLHIHMKRERNETFFQNSSVALYEHLSWKNSEWEIIESVRGRVKQRKVRATETPLFTVVMNSYHFLEYDHARTSVIMRLVWGEEYEGIEIITYAFPLSCTHKILPLRKEIHAAKVNVLRFPLLNY